MMRSRAERQRLRNYATSTATVASAQDPTIQGGSRGLVSHDTDTFHPRRSGFVGRPRVQEALRSRRRDAPHGTLFYWNVEGWGLLDSLYFSVITLTTVGYSDFSPTTAGGKVFTMLYIFVGIGNLLGFVNTVAERSLQRRREDRNEP
jgi:Ion channel